MYGIMGLKKGGKSTSRGKGVKYSKAKKEQKKSYQQLDRIVRQGKQDQDYRSGFSSPSTVIGGMTQKQQDFIARNRRKDGSLNSAAQSVLNFYSDDRSDYQRDLNKFIKSSPTAREAYLDRFPIGGALNLGIPAAFNALAPAPLKMLGAMAGDIGKGAYTAAKQGLGYLVPKLIREDVGPGVQKLWGDIKDAPSGFGRDAKALLTGKLSPIETANLGIIKDEQQDDQNPLGNLIEGDQTSEDTHDEILEDLLGVDASQNIAYDPRRPIHYPLTAETSELIPSKNPFSPGDELDDILMEDELDKMLRNTREWPYNFPADPAYDDTPMDVEEDIFDPSQDVMPNVPVTMDEKRDAISKGYNWLEGATDDWGEAMVDRFYNKMRGYQGKGMEYGPFEGVINKPESYYIENQWQYPDTDELVDQIEWNTANRPLGWSGGETPELTKDLIEENITTDWDFNQGGYLKKYDDGGYANMSTFEKLKAINDSIAEG
jgi:hypothetical protein